jgi:hypothetical protein
MARSAVHSDTFDSYTGWTDLNDWNAGTCTVASGNLVGAGGTGTFDPSTIAETIRNGDTFAVDQYAKITTATGTFAFTGSGYGPGVIVRCSGNINTSNAQMDFYFACVDDNAASGGSHTCRLGKIINGIATTLGATQSITYTDGDTVELEVTGGTDPVLTFYKNGVSQFTRTDNTGTRLTSGKTGVIASQTSRITSFEGGDITAGSAQAPRSRHQFAQRRG